MDTTRVPERLSLREGSEWHGNFELTELGLFFFLRVRLSRSHFSSPGRGLASDGLGREKLSRQTSLGIKGGSTRAYSNVD